LSSFAHSRVELCPFLGEPLFPLLVLIGTRPAAFDGLLAEFAESLIGLEVVLEIATDELDHDAVIEQTDTGCCITLGRYRKTGERIQHALLIFSTRLPLRIARHFDHRAQACEPLADECSDVCPFAVFQDLSGCSNDRVRRRLTSKCLRLLRHFFEVAQILIAEVETNAKGHGVRARLTGQRAKRLNGQIDNRS
jgi:hypothetical protein